MAEKTNDERQHEFIDNEGETEAMNRDGQITRMAIREHLQGKEGSVSVVE